MEPGTPSTESSSGLPAWADVQAAGIEPVILPTFPEGTAQMTPVLTYNLSKYERGMMSPEALKEYKRRSKNEKQKVAFQRLSPSKQNQKLAIRAFRKKELRYWKKTDGVRMKRPYISIKEKSPIQQEKQRSEWKKWKANQRNKNYTQQAAADSDARRQVVKFQVKLVEAESNLNQASDFSSKDRGTPKELLLLQKTVDTCREDLCSMQHLVDCHEAVPDHDVYCVLDSDDCGIHKVVSDYNDVGKGEQNIHNESRSDEVCSTKVGRGVAVVMTDFGNNVWYDQDNNQVESDVIVAALPRVPSINASLDVESNGKCTESANTFADDGFESVISIADDGFDSNSPTPCRYSLFIDQHHRFESTMVHVFGHAHASFWQCRGNGDLSSKGIEIARSRADQLSICPNDPDVTAWQEKNVRKKFGPDLEELHSLVTFKRMDSNAITVFHAMSRHDFKQLLTKRLYVTDAFIYMYSALLLERDHAMSLVIPGWKRSWIYGSHFYALLSPNRYQYNYNRVKKHGRRQVPGNSKNARLFPFAVAHLPFAHLCVLILPLRI